MGAPEIVVFLVSVLFFLLVFLAIRSIMLWYWKVDKALANQESQTALLQRQNQLIEQQTQLLREFKDEMGNNPIDPNRDPRL